jgi:hypothetical protein
MGWELSPFPTSATIWSTVLTPMMDDECGLVGGMSGREKCTRRKPAQCHFVHLQFHMIYGMA